MRMVAGSDRLSASGSLSEVEVWEKKYIESDTALLQRVLGRDVGGNPS